MTPPDSFDLDRDILRWRKPALAGGIALLIAAVIGAVFNRGDFFHGYLLGYLFWPDRPSVQTHTDVVDTRTSGEIIRDILEGIENLIHAEIRLALTEMAYKIRQVKNASVFVAVSLPCGALGAACLVLTCIAAMTLVMPLWLAALLIGIRLFLVSGGAFALGRTRIEHVDPTPRQTVETIQDDLEWAKHHAS